MTPTLTLDADALARLRVALGRQARSLRPVRLSLDSDGTPLRLDLPGPDYLAALLALDVAAYRRGATLLVRPEPDAEPEPLAVPSLVPALREILAGLPDRDDAGDAYADVRRAAEHGSGRVLDYLAEVLRRFVATLPTAPAVVRPKAPRRPAVSAVERMRSHRARRRVEERLSAAWALASYLADDEDGPAPEPGDRVSGLHLFNYADDLLDYAVERYVEAVVRPAPGDDAYGLDLDDRLDLWQEIREEWLPRAPSRPRPVSRRVLFDVASLAGFTVTRPHGSVALVVRALRRLSARTAEALSRSGVEEPEHYADEAVAEVLARVPASAPEALDPRALALPHPIAYAIAGADDADVVSTFGRVARFHLTRHPEDRPAVGAVALALRDGDPDELVPQIRARCAADVSTEGDPITP
jgi:hypothetical protein